MDDENQQLDLFGNPVSPPPTKQSKGKQQQKKPHSEGRQEGVNARKFLTDSIFGKKGDEECIEEGTIHIHRITFNKTPNQLHKQFNTGGDRAQLPEPYQQALEIQEITCGQAVRNHVVSDESVGHQTLVNEEITDVIVDQAHRTDGLLSGLFKFLKG